MDDRLLITEAYSDEFLPEDVYAQLKAALTEFSEDSTYEALDRYYRAVHEASEITDKLVAVKLLQHSLDVLFQRRATPPFGIVEESLQRLNDYTSRLDTTVSMLSPVADPVPGVMHFVWVGGSEVGDIQRDYMNIWRKVLAGEGYRFNLWYDSDALLAFKMNRVILDSARAHAMESGGDQETVASQLSQMIEDRARVLKRQMWDYLQQPRWAGRADEARIDLMVRVYGEDRPTLEAFRQRCLDTHLAMIGPDLRLRDVGQEFQEHFLRDVYQREVAMRGNFAAASDVVRLQAVHLEGGRYSDMDYLPPFAEKPGGVDIAGFSASARVGVLQQLLNHDDSLMPGRDPLRYDNRTEHIPAEHREALLAFAQGKPGVDKLFTAPMENLAPYDGLRMGTAHGAAITGEMNAHFLAQPNSAMIESIMQVIRFNYDVLFEVERQLTAQGISWNNEQRLFETIDGVINARKAQGGLTQSLVDFLPKVTSAVFTYYQDGIRTGARGTIAMTGPGAAVTGLTDYNETHVVFEQAEAVRGRLKLLEGYNLYTEEEFISGWTVNGTAQDWLAAEHERWTSGKLKSRYTSNLSELLNEQTLTFKRGWPVIEGKPVLLTSVLQQMLDELGEPFVRAMNDRLSGDVTFHSSLSIGVDQREQIRAQPDVELPPSIGAESLGNLNEALSRIAAGKLAIEHLSPVHRVVLGGLFGAMTLDDAGFASTWQVTRTLAENTQDRGLVERYVQIEQSLRQRSPADFQVGLGTTPSPLPAESNSQALRVLAFNEPLSVRQWGERIREIEGVARQEYQVSILQRGNPIRARMYQAGAVSAKQLPQELLVRGSGDPGRRCYPLALVMAAALEGDARLERALIGRLASANVAQDDAQTHTFLRALDELRSFPMAQFGEKRGTLDLPQAMQILEEKTASASLMLNTDNHSLLLSKVIAQGETSYRFYDPNFGLYGFAQLADMKQGFETYLADQALAQLYGIEDISSAVFSLIDLDGARIAAQGLPSQGSIGELLNNRSGSPEHTVEPWKHHAALRSRALSENARLGRAVAELDGRRWAQAIESATRDLLVKHSLAPDYVPLYQTVEPAGEGKWSLSLVNSKDPARTLSVTLEDPTWFAARNWLHDQFMSLGKQLPPEVAPHEPAAINTLNSGFAILALMQALRWHEGGDTPEQGAPMSLAVRLHSYVIYSQLAHGVIADIVGIVKLVELALLDERLIATTASSVMQSTLRFLAVEGAAGLLALINVGFDIYQLISADDASARSIAAIQLSFDLGTVVLAGSALAVGGTFAAVAGPLAVIVGGIGFGLGALARNYTLILLRAQNVGKYIYSLKSALTAGGCTVQDGVVHPIPEAVILAIDLRAHEITLGSHGMCSAVRHGPGLPSVVVDPARAIDMRERWGLPERAGLAQDIHAVILPSTPKCHFIYDYQLMPGGANRHDLGFDEARELEYDAEGERTFWFSPWTPCEYILYKLFPIYQPTRVNVVLDEQCRALYVPQMPIEWRGKISYEIEAVAGRYSLSLSPGVVALDLLAQHDPIAVSWVIRSTWVSDTAVVFQAQGLEIDGITLQVAPEGEMILELDQGQLFQVDWSNQRLILLEQSLPDLNTAAATLKRLNQLTHEHRLSTPFLSLQHFNVPFADPDFPVYTHACYELARERILYARDLPNPFTDEIQLAAVIADDAFFFHREAQTVWRVDALTAQVSRRYRLFSPQRPSRVVSCQQVGIAIHVVQQVSNHEGIDFQFEYLLHPDALELTGFSTTADEAESFYDEFVRLGWNAFLSGFNPFEVVDDDSLEMNSDIVTWRAAAVVSLQIHVGATTHSAWCRRRDGWMVNGKDLPIRNPILLALPDDDSSALIFYDGQKQTLWSWQQAPNAGPGFSRLLLADVDSEQHVVEGHLAQTTHGLVFDIRTVPPTLCALNEQWLHKQPDWLAALVMIAEQHQADVLDIVGLSDTQGRPFAARYLDHRVLLVDSDQGHNVRTLGMTPDKTALWLFVPESGRLLRQALLTVEQMQLLFGTRSQLSQLDARTSPQRVWRGWWFDEVVVRSGGLQGRTREGVILDLVDGEPARVVGVGPAFIRAQSSLGTLEERIQRLIAHQPHASILTAGHAGSRYQWYDTVAQRLLSTSARDDGQWVTCLGTLPGRTFLLYDPVDHLLFSDDHQVWSEKVSAYRNEHVLTINSSELITELNPILPDGVDTLILGFERAGMTCQVAIDDWSRLDCIVVDFPSRQSSLPVNQSELVLEMQGLDDWWLSMGGGHLVLTDPDSGRSLIIRDAMALPWRTRRALTMALHLRGKYQSVALEELVQAWEVVGSEGQVYPLGATLEQSNEV